MNQCLITVTTRLCPSFIAAVHMSIWLLLYGKRGTPVHIMSGRCQCLNVKACASFKEQPGTLHG